MSTWAGNLIAIARRRGGLSQRELAHRAGTSQAAISAYEAGQKSPTLETMARLVRAAGFDPRITLEPLEDHDEWLARYEANLPAEDVARWRAVLLGGVDGDRDGAAGAAAAR